MVPLQRLTEDQRKRQQAIDNFLQFLNQNSSAFVLKGGTALAQCYNLDRFSEDVDLDQRDIDPNFFAIGEEFCRLHGYGYNKGKDTDTTKRFSIYYTGQDKPLKVEVSLRQLDKPKKDIVVINDILTYTIGRLGQQKAFAYVGRDQIRDLYDICFIYNHYKELLPEYVIDEMANAFEHKGFDHFDYIVNDQKDELIDPIKLGNDFLQMYSDLGLLADESEKSVVATTTKHRDIMPTLAPVVSQQLLTRPQSGSLLKTSVVNGIRNTTLDPETLRLIHPATMQSLAKNLPDPRPTSHTDTTHQHTP